MKATYDGTWLWLGQDGLALYESGGYGRPGKGKLRLAPEEGLYLLVRKRIELPGYDFEKLLQELSKDPVFFRRYLVYRDLRERGYALQTGPHDFRVFRRGERPGKGQSYYLVRVLAERDLVDFACVAAEVETAGNMRKTYLIAAVDDEGELTYYEVKVDHLAGAEGEDPVGEGTARGEAFGPTGLVATGTAPWLLEEGYGKPFDQERTMLSPAEILYLMDEKRLTLTENGAPLTREAYQAVAAGADSEIVEKAVLYTDLRRRGYAPKTGYKFGHHFRVYGGGVKHSLLLAHALPAGTTLTMAAISRSVRLAHSVKKKMLFGSVHNNDIQYIEFARIKM
ncbi:tRNA-intron lyase [Methanofollis formosanus]|uniref:tRNA-intron lyase n=1 Tax=Methanofollis formosanus TaxID=299308 RepID=A0A8G1EFQ4_9EURY|nr:tRNA-intron lyase [Methanofollis formosanus]QYZ79018.1 tRNA-intron lyase [Methanofollis formosanus]